MIVSISVFPSGAVSDFRLQCSFILSFSLWGKSHPSLISTYIKSAEDPDPIVRGYSLRTLGHIGKNTQQIRNTILNHLHDPSQHVQNEARDALAELNQKLK